MRARNVLALSGRTAGLSRRASAWLVDRSLAVQLNAESVERRRHVYDGPLKVRAPREKFAIRHDLKVYGCAIVQFASLEELR